MKQSIRWLLSCNAILIFIVGCASLPADEQRKVDYQKQAQERIEHMEANLSALEERAQLLLGTPRQELAQAINDMILAKEHAKAELDELKDRDLATWVEKKSSVDSSLFEMDATYNRALGVLHERAF